MKEISLFLLPARDAVDNTHILIGVDNRDPCLISNKIENEQHMSTSVFKHNELYIFKICPNEHD